MARTRKLSVLRLAPIFILPLSVYLVYSIVSIKCLDSPVKIQRTKQQQLQQQQQQQQDQLQIQPSNSIEVNSNNRTVDRVRRTNSETNINNFNANNNYNFNQQQNKFKLQISSQQQVVRSECPSNKLRQQLLPPEYSGQGKARCDCESETSGWRINCYSTTPTSFEGSEGSNEDDNYNLSSSNYDTIHFNQGSNNSSNHNQHRTSANNDKSSMMFSSASHNHFSQTFPTLFSVKYSRNNMIEIDCDQAAPNYKAAMLQGFNVNEISSFAFIGCQLPNISFAVLLHRTRSLGANVAAAAGVIDGSSNNRLQQSPGHQLIKPNRSMNNNNSNNKLQANANMLRNRRNSGDDLDELPDDAPSDATSSSQAASSSTSPPSSVAPVQQQQHVVKEPRVRSLMVDLNTVVDQRTLISLLTGLDHLESLQLYKMQLNVTSFVNQANQVELDAHQSNSAAAAHSSDLSLASSNPSPATTNQQQQQQQIRTGSDQASVGATQPILVSQGPGLTGRQSSTTTTLGTTTPTTGAPSVAMAPSQHPAPPPPPSSIRTIAVQPQTTATSRATTTTTSSSTTTSTTTTPAPQQQQQQPDAAAIASVSVSSTQSSSPPRPINQHLQAPSGARNQARPPIATTTTTSTSTSTSTLPSTSGQSGSGAVVRPVSSSAATRPPISMGAPRGLVIAQATGLPPSATAANAPPTTPATVTSSPATSAPSSPISGATVPSIPLASVLSATRPDSGQTATGSTPGATVTSSHTTSGAQLRQAPASTTTTTTISSSIASPVAPSTVRQQQQNQNHNQLISIGTSQSQSVSYTSQASASLGQQQQQQQQHQNHNNNNNNNNNHHHHQHHPNTNQHQAQSQPSQRPGTSQSMFHLISNTMPTTTTTITSSQSSSPSGGGSSTTTTSSTSSQQLANSASPTSQLTPNRLHQTPSSWFAQSSGVDPTTTFAAGSRLQGPATATAPAASTTTSDLSTASGHGGSESAATPASSPDAWASTGLSAPANTPTYGSPPTTNFEFRRTNQNGNNHRHQSNRHPAAPTTRLQSFNQPTTMTTAAATSSVGGEQPFVAAGGRLPVASSFNNANGNQMFQNFAHPRRQQATAPTTTTTALGSNTNRQFQSLGTTTTSANNNNNINNHPATTNSISARSQADEADDPDGDLLFASSLSTLNNGELANSPDHDDDDRPRRLVTTPGARPRQRRWALDEFELSLGELLPKLRHLKLESFMDLSLINRRQRQPASGDSANQRRRPTGGDLAQLQPRPRLRFRRQFEAGDAPENDASFESPSASSLDENDANAPDSSDNNFTDDDHNSVMADDRPRSSSTTTTLSSRRIADMMDADVEPGETLWRSASDMHDSSPIVITAPPPPPPMSNHANNKPLDASASSMNSAADSEQLLARQRQLSASILQRLFSKLTNLRVLEFVSNELPIWPDYVLQDSRKSLNRLYLYSNNIRQLGKHSFANLTELQNVDLSSNQLRQLDANLFQDSTQLRHFRAIRNLFRKLPLKLMSKWPQTKALSKLDTLDLSKNRYLSQFVLESQIGNNNNNINLGVQLQLAPLVSLNLSDCSLTDQFVVLAPAPSSQQHPPSSPKPIVEQLFASLPELTSVSLQGNKFRHLLNQANLFAKNHRLQKLDLSNNQLQTLNEHLFNANSSQLTELLLNHNQLRDLPQQILFNLRNLRRLSLAHNQLTHLQAKIFDTNQYIEYLDLSYNQLQTINTLASGKIPFGSGSNLKSLNLAHNNLSQFNEDVFDISWGFYTNLHHLDLSHNQFSGQISMPIFYTIVDEMMLNLASNSIQSVNIRDLIEYEQVLDQFAADSTTGSGPVDPSAESLASVEPGELANPASSDEAADSDRPQHHRQQQQRQQHQHRHRSPTRTQNQQASAKVPTVLISLSHNPIACDCALEPLMSYLGRVSAASNPSLIASIFASNNKASSPKTRSQQQQHSSSGDRNSDYAGAQLAADSRYSVLPSGSSSAPAAAALSSTSGARQPQVLYRLNFERVQCAQPANMRGVSLREIGTNELLCPISDERICPKACSCHYQSAFRIVFVDCNSRQLTAIPNQLTSAMNFKQFEVDLPFKTGASAASNAHNAPQNGVTETKTITSVDKVIIKLMNNSLTSIDELGKLFQVVDLQDANDLQQLPGTSQTLPPDEPMMTPGPIRTGYVDFDSLQPLANTMDQRARFARAPLARGSSSSSSSSEPSTLVSSTSSSSSMDDDMTLASDPESPNSAASGAMLNQGDQAGVQANRKKISPALIARTMQQATNNINSNRRSRRQVISMMPSDSDSDIATNGNNNNAGSDSSISHGSSSSMLASDPALSGEPSDGPNAAISPSSGGSQSTAVLESAEHYRNRRYPLSCELYLDNNLIETIPDSFMPFFDHIKLASLRAGLAPPQAALPSMMLDPPVHAKLSHHHVVTSSGHLVYSGANDGNTNNNNNQPRNLVLDAPAPSDVAPSSLFGASDSKHLLAADKKAAIMETVSRNMRLQRASTTLSQTGGGGDILEAAATTARDSSPPGASSADQQLIKQLTISPSLTVLSLRYNNIGQLTPRILHRLGKLIKSSNTKLYLGHNPFNCSNNFLLQWPADNSSSVADVTSNDLSAVNANQLRPVSPMGDQIMASSDPVSGAYLEAAPNDNNDLAPATSNTDTVSNLAAQHPANADGLSMTLTPSDCPVGQLKTWLTRHYASIGDLDELYCVHMPTELANKLRLSPTGSQAAGGSNATLASGSGLSLAQLDRVSELRNRSSRLANYRHPTTTSGGGGASVASNRFDHDHPWAGPSAMALISGSYSQPLSTSTNNNYNSTHVRKNGLTWNSELLMATAKLIDIDMADMCPYSNTQLIDPSALGFLSTGHQQALISVAIVAILISLCLLMMLVYFGDTQTILAFVYIHMNPIYRCLRLNESHLDGEKLYDAFVSYSSADRDIVMQLIEHLEQPGAQFNGQQLLTSGKGTNLDRSRDTLVTEADLRPDYGLSSSSPSAGQQTNGDNINGTLNRRSTGNSFQELSTMSRSTSRMMLNGSGDNLDTSQHRNSVNLSASASQLHHHHHHANNQAARPYRLCIHERDWLPGHLISWNIVNSVQNSRRTILILSKEFIKSVWFQVEFHTAYYQMLEDKIDRLIVIVRGDLPPKHELDKNLAFLLTTKTYLTWGEKWFWERLHYALPHRQGAPPPLISKHQQQQQFINTNGKPRILMKEQDRIQIEGNQHYQSIHELNGTVKSSSTPSSKGLFGSVTQHNQQQHQEPLIMSNIGKDCSNLVLSSSSSSAASQSQAKTNLANRQQASASSSSSSSASASSYLSGSGSSSTNHLFNPMTTTSNDLLSAAPTDNNYNQITTSRFNTGSAGPRTSSPLADSGRVTASHLSSSPISINDSTTQPVSPQQFPRTTTSGGVTSILLDGGHSSSPMIQVGTTTNNLMAGNGGPGSKMRAQKQERLQNFVDNEISNRLNLSEL